MITMLPEERLVLQQKQLNDAFNSVKDDEAVFTSRITKISVEMIGENEESIIIIEKKLR